MSLRFFVFCVLRDPQNPTSCTNKLKKVHVASIPYTKRYATSLRGCLFHASAKQFCGVCSWRQMGNAIAIHLRPMRASQGSHFLHLKVQFCNLQVSCKREFPISLSLSPHQLFSLSDFAMSAIEGRGQGTDDRDRQ